MGVGGNQELSFEYTKFEIPFKYPSGGIEMDIQVWLMREISAGAINWGVISV